MERTRIFCAYGSTPAHTLQEVEGERKSVFIRGFSVDIIIVDNSVETVNNPDFTRILRVDALLFFSAWRNLFHRLRGFLTNVGGCIKILAIVGQSRYNIQGIVSYGTERANGKGRKELRQREHFLTRGRGARAQAPGRYFRLGRTGRLRARGVRDPLELHRRGARGARQGHHAHALRRRQHRGGGQRARLSRGLEPQGKALQLGACVLRALRRRQVQQSRRRQL